MSSKYKIDRLQRLLHSWHANEPVLYYIYSTSIILNIRYYICSITRKLNFGYCICSTSSVPDIGYCTSGGARVGFIPNYYKSPTTDTVSDIGYCKCTTSSVPDI